MNISKAIVSLILLFSSWQALATQCVYSSLTLSLPNSFVYQGAGSGMISTAWHQASNASLMNCDVTGSDKAEIVTESPLAVSGAYSFDGAVYALLQSSLPNISFIIALEDTKGKSKPYQGLPVTTYEQVGSVSSTFGIRVFIRLVATGRLDPGSYILPAVDLLRTGVSQGGHYTGSAITKTTGTIITSKSPTCKVLVAREYTLPKIDLSDIPRENATAGTIAVAFSATCEKSASAYNVKYSLVDMNNSVAGANYVTLRSVAESARLESVGLQLMDGTDTLLMGTAYPFAQVPTAGGIISKTLLVSYVRRAMTALSPGRVQGEVALILSYE
ncbi:fimbrial protein [Pseudomonas edaphica]|uniref:fimbrial protein n=1 Tax=Pseudomonas edaphica TaxID=2006980 RepID=UPI003D141CB3